MNEPCAELLRRLLDGDSSGPQVLSAALRSGLDLDEPHLALAVRTTADPTPLARRQLSGVLRERVTLFGVDNECMFALVSATGPLAKPAERRSMLQRVLELQELANVTTAIAWSGVYTGLRGWQRCLAEAKQALAAIERVIGPGGAASYAEVGVLRLVLEAHDSDHVRLLQERLLGPLFAYDRAAHADLAPTLEAYLETGCHARRTAEVLGVHRNSVCNRLRRIKELVELDLEDANSRLLVQLTMAAARGICEPARPRAHAGAPLF